MNLSIRQFASFLSIVLTMVSPFCFATEGASNGGGGKGVVCRNPDHSVKSVELLDLWEAREIHGYALPPSSGSIESDVDRALVNLSDSIPFHIEASDCGDGGCLLQYMRKSVQQFLKSSPTVLRKHGVKLEDTDDAMELMWPNDCSIEQVVDYPPVASPILVNEDLYEKMDEPNQAALIVHEAYYEMLRQWVGESNSLRVRRAVGYVFSGRKLNLPTGVPNQKGDWLCNATLSPDLGGEVFGTYVRVSADYSKVYFSVIQGTPLIGVAVRNAPGESTFLKAMFNGPCDESIIDKMGSMGGPVEYDREIQFERICKGGKRSFALRARAPGGRLLQAIPLSCRRIK